MTGLVVAKRLMRSPIFSKTVLVTLRTVGRETAAFTKAAICSEWLIAGSGAAITSLALTLVGAAQECGGGDDVIC